MSLTCKNRCGASSIIDLEYINGAWLPAINVCTLDNSVDSESCSESCVLFTGSTYLWDACFNSSISIIEGTVVDIVDLNEGLFLQEVDTGKGPGLAHVPNHGKNFNMLAFNGVNQSLGNDFATTAFTVVVVVQNISTNIAENTGGIFAITSSPFVEEILLGWENDTFVVKHDNGEDWVNVVDPISSSGSGFNVVALRYTGVEGVGNVQLFLNGGSSSTNSGSFVFGSSGVVANIGSSFYDYFLSGNIGWVAYYDSAIDDDELNRAITSAGNLYSINTEAIIL